MLIATNVHAVPCLHADPKGEAKVMLVEKDKKPRFLKTTSQIFDPVPAIRDGIF